MAASEAICGVHENQSVKRSGQAGGAARAEGGKYVLRLAVRRCSCMVSGTIPQPRMVVLNTIHCQHIDSH
ncbi:hypothetical protein GDQ58_01875 [Salmonella enterica subsp. diarizonae]|nr:hypothetical protein [Salmonella enterica subsp. diarizonae]